VRRALVRLVVPLLLAGCSSSPEEPDLPAESAFRDGTCSIAAPDLLALGRALPELGEDRQVDPEVQRTLAETQDRLFALSEGAPPPDAGLLDELVERIGGVRLRAVGNTYEPSLGEDLQASYDEVVSTCTGT
jgi:hypothetical protein